MWELELEYMLAGLYLDGGNTVNTFTVSNDFVYVASRLFTSPTG